METQAFSETTPKATQSDTTFPLRAGLSQTLREFKNHHFLGFKTTSILCMAAVDPQTKELSRHWKACCSPASGGEFAS